MAVQEFFSPTSLSEAQQAVCDGAVSSWLAGWAAPADFLGRVASTSMLGSGISREIHHHLPVLLEDLPRKDLGIKIRRVDVA